MDGKYVFFSHGGTEEIDAFRVRDCLYLSRRKPSFVTVELISNHCLFFAIKIRFFQYLVQLESKFFVQEMRDSLRPYFSLNASSLTVMSVIKCQASRYKISYYFIPNTARRCYFRSNMLIRILQPLFSSLSFHTRSVSIFILIAFFRT